MKGTNSSRGQANLSQSVQRQLNMYANRGGCSWGRNASLGPAGAGQNCLYASAHQEPRSTFSFVRALRGHKSQSTSKRRSAST
jgi:hypothetical protein